MSNLNLASELSWVYLGSLPINNPNFRRLGYSTFPITGTKNCYRITALSTDEVAINRAWQTIGAVKLSIFSPSLSTVFLTYKKLPFNSSAILFTPFRASEYKLEFSINSWIKNATFNVDETTVYVDTEVNANLILNDLEVGFQSVNSKLDQLLGS